MIEGASFESGGIGERRADVRQLQPFAASRHDEREQTDQNRGMERGLKRANHLERKYLAPGGQRENDYARQPYRIPDLESNRPSATLRVPTRSFILRLMLVLGLSNMRDAAAAVIHDGRLVAAAEEERFVRQKHVTALPSSMPSGIVSARPASLLNPLDGIAVPWKYWKIARRARLALGSMLCSPQLCVVKGRRSIERLGQEWKELLCLRRELRRRVGPGGPPSGLSRPSSLSCSQCILRVAL